MTHIPKITVTDLPSRLIGCSHPSPSLPLHKYIRTRTHARTHTLVDAIVASHISQHDSLFSLRHIFFPLRFFFFSTVVLAAEIGGCCLIILDAGPDFTKRWWREAVVHAAALESSCYRLTSDEKCMYKCTKIIVCCSRDPANYRK